MLLRRKWLAFHALEGRIRVRPERPRPLAHLGLWLTSAALALVCAFNDDVATPQLQTIAQALFCVAAGALYALLMSVRLIARWVMSCVGEEEAVEEDDVDESEEEEPEFVIRDLLPRETIIATMYLGGLGMFLALAPLCMWSGDATLAFLCALLLLSATLEPVTQQLTHALLLLAVTLTLTCLIALHATGPHHLAQGAMHTFEHNAHIVAQLAVQMPPQRWPAWPFALMAATSPCLLYMGAGRGSHQGFHSMPPSKTLETGLPICLLLACVVLGWFNPIETLMLQELFRLRAWVLMSLLAPPLLVAQLALLIHMLRSQSILAAVAILAAVYGARQQTLRAGPPSALDAGALVSAGLALVLAVARLVRPGVRQAASSV